MLYRRSLTAMGALLVTSAVFAASVRATVPAPVLSLDFEECADSLYVGPGAEGGVGCQAGPYGFAADFDGVDDKIELADQPQYSMTDAVTVSAWIKPDVVHGNIVNKWYALDSYGLAVVDGQASFSTAFPDGSQWGVSIKAAAPVPSGTWVHLAGVYDGAAVRLYVDGQEAASTAASGTLQQSARPIAIGSHPPWNSYDGLIDSVRIWDLALSAGQIAEVAGRTVVVGEVGTALVNHLTQTIQLAHTYENPVVFALPISFNDNQEAMARITNVTATSFDVAVEEAPNTNKVDHDDEAVSYVVLETGRWQLDDGTRLEVGTVSTDAQAYSESTAGTTSAWTTVSLSSVFRNTPAVFTQVQSRLQQPNPPTERPPWVFARNGNPTTTSFDIALQEEEASDTAHGTEVVGWLAMGPSVGTWSGLAYEARRTCLLDENHRTITFHTDLGSTAVFIANLSSANDADPARLRRENLQGTSVEVRIEEDTTLDNETAHEEESLSYLALGGTGLLSASTF